MQSPGYYASGKGPQVPLQITLDVSCKSFNEMLLNEKLEELIVYRLGMRGYDEKFGTEVYGQGTCPIHGRIHRSNNWVILQPHSKEVKRGNRKFMDDLPNGMICCYHKCGGRKCCPKRKPVDILWMSGPFLL